MLAVTAYPIGYAVWPRCKRYDLRFPTAQGFVGLANYATRAQQPPVVDGVRRSSCSSPSVGRGGAGPGHGAGHDHAAGPRSAQGAVGPRSWSMHRIVTVVAAYSCAYAWTPAPATWPTCSSSSAPDRAWQWRSSSSSSPRSGRQPCSSPAAAGRPVAGALEELRAAKVGWGQRLAAPYPGRPAPVEAVILVALLFRTLDAFRIFDNIFILTGGAAEQHPLGVDPRLRTCTALNLWHRLDHLGAEKVASPRWRYRLRSSARASARPRRPGGGPPLITAGAYKTLLGKRVSR